MSPYCCCCYIALLFECTNEILPRKRIQITTPCFPLFPFQPPLLRLTGEGIITLYLFSGSLTISVSGFFQTSSAASVSWSRWGSWSQCSKSCDGGVSYRTRRCLSGECPPEGSPDYREDRICNIQICPEDPLYSGSFRSQQCAEYNEVPYEGRYYLWEAAPPPEDHTKSTDEELCSLICRASGYPDVVVRMDRAVVDGTRCRGGQSLDMCIQGKCRSVGCDLKLDSRHRVDRCGVCSAPDKGRNATEECVKDPKRFIWREAPLSECSVPCGGGHMMAHSVCRNKQTGAKVDDGLCDNADKPEPRMAPCNNRPCPPR